MKKIKINAFTYFFIISACLTVMFKECLILMLIIFIHELGHVLAIKYFNYPIKSIDFLPFGGITKIEKDLNSSINADLIISVSGVLCQLVLYIIIAFFYYHKILDNSFYQLFCKYNFSILFFNLLPIIPLDGSIFLKSILEKHFSFWQSQILTVIFSFFFLLVFLYFNYFYALNNYLIICFLFYKIWIYIKELKYVENRFLLERYLHDYKYSKVKIINNIKGIQKQKKHYFQIKDKLIKEKDVLKAYFQSR